MSEFVEKELLMIPGPVPVPPRVLREISRPLISHRGPSYSRLMRETTEGLKRVFQTTNDVITFPASGTGAMEAAIVNLFSPGDTIIAIVTGLFGQRWAEIAEAFGLNVVRLDVEWGACASPSAIASALDATESTICGVLLTHNETVSGVTNDAHAIAEVLRSSQSTNGQAPILCVDAVSSLGAINLPMDEWRLDVVVAGSQKGLMLPPGLSFVALNDRAWEAHRKAQLPRYYFDFSLHKKFMDHWENPYTPAVSLLFGLAESLRMLEAIGLQENFTRHRRLGRAVREGVKALDMKLLVQDESYASNVVTAVKAPDGVDVASILPAMRERFNIILAGGAGKLRGKILRIGHVGFISESDVLATLAALGSVVVSLKITNDPSAGVRAAEKVFADKRES